MTFKLLITEIAELYGYKNPAAEIIYEPDLFGNPIELVAKIAKVDGVAIRNRTKLAGNLLAELKSDSQLKVIGRLGAGLDNIDVKAARSKGVEVVYAPDANTEATAQLVIGQLFSALRRLLPAHLLTVAGTWDRLNFMGREFSEITLGVVGFGRIGNRVAEIATFLGAQVFICTRRPKMVPERFQTCPLSDLFSKCDAVSMHVPLTEATQKMVTSELLRQMPKNGIFINSSRGEIVDEIALLDFLTSRTDVTAVLDVRQDEPPKHGGIEKLPNVVLTPHIGAFTHAAQKNVAYGVLDDMVRVLSREKPLNSAP